MKQPRTITKGLTALLIAGWMIFSGPAAVLALDANGAETGTTVVTGAGENTGAPADTGAQGCTGAGCGQGEEQGAGQGEDQGGPSLEELGAVQNESGDWVLPEGTEDTRQGAAQGTTNGVTLENSGTGADSTNTNDVEANSTTKTGINNQVTDITTVAGTANTGFNTQNKNTGSTGLTTGDAGIGVTQLKNDNTATIGGTAGLNVTGHEGDWLGDFLVNFGAQTADLSNGQSIKAVNNTTGENSENTNGISTKTEEITEVQNDGRIDNILDLLANTGQNQSSSNTGDSSITTGDANVAATLVNLLNTTVINGDLWLTVADIFGDLNGNIILPEFAALARAARSGWQIDATNESTGAESDNAIEIDISEREATSIDNEADVMTAVKAEAITGQNEATKNTGGANVMTGDGSISASNLTLANTTVEGGNWGLIIVNALNRWLGFMVGDSGEVRALSQDETIREIEARNSQTGAESENEIAISEESERTTTVENDAVINNEIGARAITGQNEATKNTGGANITTGDANVEATTINIANTTVKDASLFIAVVNIFGDWLGDLLYGGSSLAAQAGGGAGTVAVQAQNESTGAESENTIDVGVDLSQETTVNNQAKINTLLDAKIDTGGNKANANTGGAKVTTGLGELALHARTVANLVGIAGPFGYSFEINGENGRTGAESENRIKATLNEERIIAVTNQAEVSTVLPALINTGDNEANRNTLGALIETGDAKADIAINNLINKVILALMGWGGDDEAVLAELTNRITGAESDNENEVEVWRNLLTEIENQGVVNNLIDLLMNTGRNTANENTGGGDIFSGAGCLTGGIANQVNQAVLGGGSIQLTQQGSVVNQAQAGITTGENETNKNTAAAGVSGQGGGCEIAVVPEEPDEEEEVIPPAKEEPKEEGQGGGDGDGDGGDEASAAGRVAGIGGGPTEGEAPRANGVKLVRFPVAGETGQAVWLAGSTKSALWPAFLVVSIMMLAVAWHFDRQVKRYGFLPLNK